MVLRPLAGLLLGVTISAAGWEGARVVRSLTRPAALLAPLRRPGATLPTVVFVFGPTECPSRLESLDALNGIDQARVRVVGRLMVDTHDFPGWRDLVRAQRIRFPVVPVSALRVRLATAALGYAGTPLVLLFDPAGRLRYATDDPGDTGLVPALEALADGSNTTLAGRQGPADR